MPGLCTTNGCLFPGLVRKQGKQGSWKTLAFQCLPVWPMPVLCGKGRVSKLTKGPREPPETKRLTCPLENMNTRAAPAAVNAQVKKVPSKAWDTEL